MSIKDIKADRAAGNNLFREHVTSTAFNLSLSKNMIAMLAMIASENNPPDDLKAVRDKPFEEHQSHRKKFVAVCGRYDTVTCGNALLRRGLIWSPYEKWPGIYCLTDAGEHVIELLRIAGLVEALGFEELAA